MMTITCLYWLINQQIDTVCCISTGVRKQKHHYVLEEFKEGYYYE